MNKEKSTITLTFGDRAENHVGMEQIGKMIDAGEGFQTNELNEIATRLKSIGMSCEVIELTHGENNLSNASNASVLIVRGGVDSLYRHSNCDEKYNADELFSEQSTLNVDKQAFMYGRVVNKHARWNLCFDNISHDPDYSNGKGTVVSYPSVPLTYKLLSLFPAYFGEKAEDLKGEGNYYFDVNTCGIGFHGDSERRKVIAVRLGASLDLHYQWYKNNERVGERIILPLHHGDIYVMSEKAVGTDWKCRSKYTLRHATGCAKYVK